MTGVAEHFRAFTFVDRITAVTPGVRARGCYHIPPGLAAFPELLIGEAVGQLAAWIVMQAVEFRLRPVAGIVGQFDTHQPVRPGQTLELTAEVASVDDSAAAYGGRALVNGAPVFESFRCVGPMLPLADFDDPAAVRAHFDRLCHGGAEPGGFAGLPPLPWTVLEQTPDRLLARFPLPATGAFFADHFPRRPVFPGTLLMQANLDVARALTGRPAFTATDAKLRAFCEPGDTVEIEARWDGGPQVQLTTRRAGRVIGGSRVLVAEAPR